LLPPRSEVRELVCREKGLAKKERTVEDEQREKKEKCCRQPS
jgi:hypothetical protein